MKGAGTQYYRIYCDIITDIYNGKKKQGDFLPSLEKLCQTYGVGRVTVRSALKLLEDNDYIERHGRHQLPVISFDWNDLVKRKKYIIQLAKRKDGIYEIYDFFDITMPDLFSKTISLMTKEQRGQIIDMIDKYIKDKTIITEEDVSEEFIKIYFYVFAILNNELLEDLFKSLYYHIQVPLEKKTYHRLDFMVKMKVIKGIFRAFAMVLKFENYKALEKEIHFFIRNLKMNAIDYLEDICQDIQVDDIIEFQWIFQKKQNTDYISTIMKIFKQINNGNYQKGDIIPSYSKLAKQMNVSEKTIRKAIQLLNEWKAVNTVNGIGTIINHVDETQKQRLLNDEKMVVHIEMFFGALQIFILVCQPIVRYSVSRLTDEKLLTLKKRISEHRDQAFNEIIEFLFYEFYSSSIKSIFEQLQVILMWSHFFTYCGFQTTDYGLYQPELMSLIEKRNGDKIAKEIYHHVIQYFHYVKIFYEKHGHTITVLEIQDE